MEHIKCKKCDSYECCKAGFSNNRQRYKCKRCHCFFLPGKQTRYSHRKRLLLVKLYTEGNCIRSIGRLLGISHVTVIRWIKLMAKKLRPPTPTYAKHIEIDKLYFYVGSKKRKRWLWLAICRETKRILGFCTGGRGTKTLEKLFHRISPIQCERVTIPTGMYRSQRFSPKRNTGIIPTRPTPSKASTLPGGIIWPASGARSKCYSKSIAMVEAGIISLSHKFGG